KLCTLHHCLTRRQSPRIDGRLLGNLARGVENDSCHNAVRQWVENSTRFESRWRLIERILGHTREWQRVFDSRAETGARLCGGRAEIVQWSFRAERGTSPGLIDHTR